MRLTCVTKHAKRDDYFLTSKSAVNVLQGAYRNADICFLFGKQESLRNETCSEVQNANFSHIKGFQILFVVTFVKVMETYIGNGDGGYL